MSRPGQAGEPSMEDILASIRKIVAEEPSAPEHPLPNSTAAATPQPQAAPTSTGPAPDRHSTGAPRSDLMDALTKTLSKAKSIQEDEDLADLLEDVPNPPKANVDVTPRSMTERQEAEESANKLPPETANGEMPRPAGVAWSHSRVSFKSPPPGESGTAEPIIEKTVEPVPSLGDVRPEPSSFPASMSVRSFKAAFPPNGSAEKPEHLNPLPGDPAPTKRDIGSIQLSDAPAKPSEALSPSFGAGLTRHSSEPAQVHQPAKSEPQVIAAMTSSAPMATSSANLASADKPKNAPPFFVSGENSARKIETGKETQGIEQAQSLSKPAASAPAPQSSGPPIASASASASASLANPKPAYEKALEVASTKAAFSALDALAAGLAASREHEAPREPVVTTHSPTRVNEGPAPVSASPVEHTTEVRAKTANEPPQSPKSMEETVTELLKPMLREWLEENMPRMLEKALRSEVADSRKAQD